MLNISEERRFHLHWRKREITHTLKVVLCGFREPVYLVSTVNKLQKWMVNTRSQADAVVFIFATASGPTMSPSCPSMLWVTGVKRPERKSDRSPPPGAEIMNT